jgi:hypothetical protein
MSVIRNTTLCITWSALVLASATWMRLDAWPWELL